MPPLDNAPGSHRSPLAETIAQTRPTSCAAAQKHGAWHRPRVRSERLPAAVPSPADAAGALAHLQGHRPADAAPAEGYGPPHSRLAERPFARLPLGPCRLPTTAPAPSARDRDDALTLCQTAGFVAHDINNILGCILISVQRLLQDAPGDTSVRKQHGQDAIASVERAAVLARRLLAMTRRIPGNAGCTDTAELVAGMAGLLRRVLGPSIRIAATVKPGVPWTRCEKELLENALLNLALNARTAMPEGGCIAISADHATPPADGSGAHPGPPGSYVRISMTDSGCGMPPGVLARAFDPFFTTGSLDSAGLGLASVLDFTHRAGGAVEASSTPGVGTTVTLLLPAVPPEPRRLDPPEPALSGPADTPRAPATILVVEDEAELRSLMAEILSDQGIRTLLASDAEAALSILHSTAAIDLMITDLGLPDQDGRTLAQTARQQRADLPVLFVTGSAPDTFQDTGSAPDAFHDTGSTPDACQDRTDSASSRSAVLAKPFRSQALRQIVEQLLAEGSSSAA